MGELLRRGFDVYMTLVDDQQIDCVIRREVKGMPIYIDVQIKARSNHCKPGQAGTFAAMEIRRPRKNFFFIFYSEQANMYWVLPSLQLKKEARLQAGGKHAGKYSICFTNYSLSKKLVTPRPRFAQYENAFDVIAAYKGA